MPHPEGNITLELDFNKTYVEGTIVLPERTDGVFVWQGHRLKLHEGKQAIKLNQKK
jgi:hypothetical protein